MNIEEFASKVNMLAEHSKNDNTKFANAYSIKVVLKVGDEHRVWFGSFPVSDIIQNDSANCFEIVCDAKKTDFFRGN